MNILIVYTILFNCVSWILFSYHVWEFEKSNLFGKFWELYHMCYCLNLYGMLRCSLITEQLDV